MGTTITATSWRKWILTGAIVFLLLCLGCARAQVAWVTDFDEALKQAAEKEQFVVLDISASW
ncbi:MAG: hypothetical protein JXR49_12205 [Acidobacteria bacterium]|nr:hypothetical protein [Acidobacteriota bacterium]